jgi:hypothetical protein
MEAEIARLFLMFVAPVYPAYLIGRYTKMKGWLFLPLMIIYLTAVEVATRP